MDMAMDMDMVIEYIEEQGIMYEANFDNLALTL